MNVSEALETARAQLRWVSASRLPPVSSSSSSSSCSTRDERLAAARHSVLQAARRSPAAAIPSPSGSPADNSLALSPSSSDGDSSALSLSPVSVAPPSPSLTPPSCPPQPLAPLSSKQLWRSTIAPEREEGKESAAEIEDGRFFYKVIAPVPVRQHCRGDGTGRCLSRNDVFEASQRQRWAETPVWWLKLASGAGWVADSESAPRGSSKRLCVRINEQAFQARARVHTAELGAIADHPSLDPTAPPPPLPPRAAPSPPESGSGLPSG